jgi:hypothetical protein
MKSPRRKSHRACPGGNDRRSGRRENRRRRAGTHFAQAQGALPAEGFAGADRRGRDRLEIGKSIHLGEIKAPAGVEILGDKHISVVAVAAPRAEEEVAATDAAPAAGDVEMTKEKKEEGAEGAAPAAKGAPPMRKPRLPATKKPRPSRRQGRRRRSNFAVPRAARPRMENLHLIVGLGNPGAEYAQTRHNAGFLLVEKLAAQWRADWTNERKFKPGGQGRRGGKRVLLCEPQTFMNLSGESVGALVEFLPVAVAQFWWRWTTRICRWAKSGCGQRQQRRASWAGVHRAASGVARVCAVADRDRAPGRRAADHELCARKI